MKNIIKPISILAILAIVLLLPHCKKDKPDNNETWQTGSKSVLTVNAAAGEEVNDANTGLTFIFPEGAQCDIEIAKITKGEKPPIDGDGYYITFPENINVGLVFPDDATKLIHVWGWGINPGLTHYVAKDQKTWVNIPYSSQVENKKIFTLIVPQTFQFKSPGTVKTGFQYYQIASIGKDTELGQKEELIAADLVNMLKHYTDSLSPDLKTVASERMQNEIKYQLLFGSDPTYLPFWWTAVQYVIRAHININSAMTDPVQITSSLAHESGHYMMHILGGNDAYLPLYRQMPQNELHGPGTQATRSAYMIEESAYFSEYFHTGRVSSASNPEEPRMLLWDLNNMPIKTDYPAIEGFGVAMLASLHRTNPEAFSVWETTNKLVKIDAPVIGASFADIFDIMAKGAKSTDELRTHINQYLVSVDKDDLLSPLLQRLGWGYYAKMRIVDKDGAPLAGIKARNVCIGGGKTWYGAYYSTPTGADGLYTLPGEVFGGNSILRFYKDSDSLDVEINVDWAKKTSETIELGDIIVDFTNPLPPFLENKDYGLYIGSFWQYECPNTVNIPTGYIPRHYNATGELITVHSNGAGSIEFTFDNTTSGEICTGSGTIFPHHIDNSGWLPIDYYSFNLTFEYKFTPDGVPFYKYAGTISGIDRLDGYFTSRKLQCEGTMTLYWFDNEQQLQSCSYPKNFNNQSYLHNYQ